MYPPFPAPRRAPSWPLTSAEMMHRYPLRSRAAPAATVSESGLHDRQSDDGTHSEGSEIVAEALCAAQLGVRQTALGRIETPRRIKGPWTFSLKRACGLVALVVIASLAGLIAGLQLAARHFEQQRPAMIKQALQQAQLDQLEQEKQQRPKEAFNLANDLQILHRSGTAAFGVEAPGLSASVDQVRACEAAVKKGVRKMSLAWHPDTCAYKRLGMMHRWQCDELYMMAERKKEFAMYECLNMDMRRQQEAPRKVYEN